MVCSLVCRQWQKFSSADRKGGLPHNFALTVVLSELENLKLEATRLTQIDSLKSFHISILILFFKRSINGVMQRFSRI